MLSVTIAPTPPVVGAGVAPTKAIVTMKSYFTPTRLVFLGLLLVSIVVLSLTIALVLVPRLHRTDDAENAGTQPQQRPQEGSEPNNNPQNPNDNNGSYRPHIVFIIVDDLGSHDLGMHGSGIATPTMDSIAHEGLYLANSYVLPSCSPTRMAFLTGQYPYRYGCLSVVPQSSNYGIPLSEQLLPEVLAQAGYRNHAVGKWHVGHARAAYTPTFRGFESFYGYQNGGVTDHYAHTLAGFGDEDGAYNMRYDPKPNCDASCGQMVDERGNHSTDVFTREAIRVIQDHDEPDPLFLYLAYFAPHGPLQAPDQYLQRYQAQANWSDSRKIYASMLTAVDDGIASVVDALQAKGLWNDTLVIVTTDNGGPSSASSNYPYRGFKLSTWEGGVRGDAMVGGPARAWMGILNTRLDAMFHAIDWLPTLASLVGVTPASQNNLDGMDQSDVFRGGEALRNVVFAYSGTTRAPNGTSAVRMGQYKMIRDNTTYRLYDLTRDVSEQKDLGLTKPEMLQSLQAKSLQLESQFLPQRGDDSSCPVSQRKYATTDWGEKAWMPWCDS